MRGHLVVVGAVLSGLVAINRPHHASDLSQFTLDLTTPVAENQRGRSDMPGGGASWHSGKNSRRAQLPLDVHILNSSVSKTGDVTVKILLRNIGDSGLDIPISRDISRVEQTASKSRSLFFLRAVPVYDQKLSSDSIGVGETAGSLSVQGSLMRLEPGNSLHVLIPISATTLKRALPKNGDSIEIAIECEQWYLDDERYFIDSTSDKKISVNTSVLGFRDGKPAVLER